MPNWTRIASLIPSTFPESMSDLLDFAQTHTSVYSKMAFADYHYHILNQVYRPNQTDRQSDTPEWVMAELYAIINSLYSALDTLGYEISLAYKLSFSAGDIYISHNHAEPKKDCFRCSLPTSEQITSYLNRELNQNWFDTFKKLRNQINHKNLVVSSIVIRVDGNDNTTLLKIPRDSSKFAPPPSDFIHEINQYCLERRDNVIKLIDNAYPLIESQIRNTFKI